MESINTTNESDALQPRFWEVNPPKAATWNNIPSWSPLTHTFIADFIEQWATMTEEQKRSASAVADNIEWYFSRPALTHRRGEVTAEQMEARRNADTPENRFIQWTRTLESGNYKQGTVDLRKVDPATGESVYTAFGVACDLSGLGYWREATSERSTPNSFAYVTPAGESERTLPQDVRDYYGIENDEYGDEIMDVVQSASETPDFTFATIVKDIYQTLDEQY